MHGTSSIPIVVHVGIDDPKGSALDGVHSGKVVVADGAIAVGDGEAGARGVEGEGGDGGGGGDASSGAAGGGVAVGAGGEEDRVGNWEEVTVVVVSTLVVVGPVRPRAFLPQGPDSTLFGVVVFLFGLVGFISFVCFVELVRWGSIERRDHGGDLPLPSLSRTVASSDFLSFALSSFAAVSASSLVVGPSSSSTVFGAPSASVAAVVASPSHRGASFSAREDVVVDLSP